MLITECIKEAHDMKKLHTKLIAAQKNKKEHQDQMEPLQEWAAEVIAQAEEETMNMAQT
jgi:hypothetical protein